MTLRSAGYALLSGILVASTFPPFRFAALAWLALLPLLWSFDRARPYEAFFLGFLCGFLAYGIIIWWVQITMVTYGGLPAWLSWLTTLALAGYMGLYVGVFGYLLVRICGASGPGVLFLAGPLWVALELARAYVLSGFPWALLGYSQYRVLPVVQIADLVGVYGISFFIVTINAGLWHYLRYPQRKPFAVVGSLAALSFLVVGYGYLRLFEVPKEAGVPTLPVAIIQGNTDQAAKWNARKLASIVRTHEGLTLAAAKDLDRGKNTAPPLIVWPEASLPLVYEARPGWRMRMRRTARLAGAYLLFGTLGLQRGPPPVRLTNSAYLIGPQGREVGRYDKVHLVPFGEYVPLSRFLFFVKKLVPVIGTFREGEEAKVFNSPGGRFGVLICFEAIFPRVVRRFRGAQFLVNMTNDAWFGRTAASEQHLSMVAMRAVEFRVPIIRAANTGISAVIDARGAILKRSPLFQKWKWVGSISPRKESVTLYARVGDVFAYACAIFVLLAWFVALRFESTRVWYD